MKSDLDRIMKERGVNALLVSGPAQHNPAMVYFTGVAHITNGDLVKKCGQQPILFHPPMEREEAAKSGYMLHSYNEYPLTRYMKEAGQDINQAEAMRLKKMLQDCGIQSGTIALYGVKEQGVSYAVISETQKLMPDVKFTGCVQDELLMEAMMTKDEDELEHIRRMAKSLWKQCSERWIILYMQKSGKRNCWMKMADR